MLPLHNSPSTAARAGANYTRAAFRASRSQDAAQGSLSALRRGAEGEENLVPLIVAAVKSRATLGEIADAMRQVFGEHGRS